MKNSFLPKPAKQFRERMSAMTALMCLTLAACSQSVTETAKAQTDDAVQTVQTPETTQKPETIQAASSDVKDKHEGHDHAAHSSDAPDANQAPMIMAPSNIDYVYTAAPDDHVIGQQDAPVEIITYASVTCSHCALWFNNEWPKFKTEQIDTGQVKMVFRPYPTPPAELAVPGFIVADCAGEDKYFEHILYQFKNQDTYFDRMQNGDGQAAFMEMAAEAGLNSEAELDKCFADKSHIDRISRSVQRAEASGLSGVPGFIINGELYPDQDASTAKLGVVIEAAKAKKP